jgi:hypothetical protein
VFSRWEYVVSGPPIGQIAIAESLAMPGETVISPQALCYVDGFVIGTPLSQLVELPRRHRINPEHYTYVRVEDYVKGSTPLLEPLAPLRLKQRHVSLLERQA